MKTTGLCYGESVCSHEATSTFICSQPPERVLEIVQQHLVTNQRGLIPLLDVPLITKMSGQAMVIGVWLVWRGEIK